MDTQAPAPLPAVGETITLPYTARTTIKAEIVMWGDAKDSTWRVCVAKGARRDSPHKTRFAVFAIETTDTQRTPRFVIWHTKDAMWRTYRERFTSAVYRAVVGLTHYVRYLDGQDVRIPLTFLELRGQGCFRILGPDFTAVLEHHGGRRYSLHYGPQGEVAESMPVKGRNHALQALAAFHELPADRLDAVDYKGDPLTSR
ncbi:hypothetical protein ACFWYW_23865 [Nonomuraea sp. NPDC059023]|uniref:hypothetical protein n=1 Tax=unclassified Nonomuraea TaxID=2593643 RepID=UPI0036A6CF93